MKKITSLEAKYMLGRPGSPFTGLTKSANPSTVLWEGLSLNSQELWQFPKVSRSVFAVFRSLPVPGDNLSRSFLQGLGYIFRIPAENVEKI
ncbi:hypothetical protein [Desertivirga xinjiangensis]|uniref:hypothetical protein n=1 Tax=Desertivirga xinjiangensis TaxID=539206 RepID=UPI00210AA3FF|nr:hypothetical protein [Pedobacter xinjiangensis]